MVLCVVVGCSKPSGRDKDVSVYHIPKIIVGKGLKIEELSRRHRNGFIAAISRSDHKQSLKTTESALHILCGKASSIGG